MKKVFIIVIGLMGTVYAQWDSSTYVRNLPLQAKLISVLATRASNPSNDSLFTVYMKWRAAKRNVRPTPRGTTTITVDSIPTVELANLYDYVLRLPDGIGLGSSMRSQMKTARSVNKYLEALCTAIEAKWDSQTDDLIKEGDKLLLGK